MIIRDLDSYYFRVNRDGSWQSVCFSDLTEEEMRQIEDKSAEWWKKLACGLGRRLRTIGDILDICVKDECVKKGGRQFRD